jgi:NAD(P)-dependent dehydrogenase (short-subunit alcohol dehydrogenase family)
MSSFLTELFSLSGRNALVTGGSSGIGYAIAEALAKAGARVVLAARGPERLRDAVDRLRVAGCAAEAISVDLADRAEVGRVADQAVRPFGEIDILVTAAGVNPRPPMDELTESDWDTTMAINLDAPFLLGQRLGPGMAARGWGRIINIGSQQSIRAFGNSGAYGVSKAAVVALTRSQAEAWSARGVCCNTIAPGFVRTPLSSAVSSDPTRAAAMAGRTMIGRNGEPEDFAGLAVFLAGNASAYLTGQTIFADGGFSAT